MNYTMLTGSAIDAQLLTFSSETFQFYSSLVYTVFFGLMSCAMVVEYVKLGHKLYAFQRFGYYNGEAMSGHESWLNAREELSRSIVRAVVVPMMFFFFWILMAYINKDLLRGGFTL